MINRSDDWCHSIHDLATSLVLLANYMDTLPWHVKRSQLPLKVYIKLIFFTSELNTAYQYIIPINKTIISHFYYIFYIYIYIYIYNTDFKVKFNLCHNMHAWNKHFEESKTWHWSYYWYSSNSKSNFSFLNEIPKVIQSIYKERH